MDVLVRPEQTLRLRLSSTVPDRPGRWAVSSRTTTSWTSGNTASACRRRAGRTCSSAWSWTASCWSGRRPSRRPPSWRWRGSRCVTTETASPPRRFALVLLRVTSSRPVLQCKTYACIMESHLMGLTVDFSMGFVCFDAASKVSVRRPSVLGPRGAWSTHNPLRPWICTLCILGVFLANFSFLAAEGSGRSPSQSAAPTPPTAHVIGTEAQALPYCSEILAPIPWSICVPQGCHTCCQSIVYTKKCSNQNPYVLRNSRLFCLKSFFFLYTNWELLLADFNLC